MPELPSDLDVRPDSVALIGWEEGTAGQVHSWFEAEGRGHIACFVHPDNEPPSIDPVVARKGRPARQFAIPTTTHFKDRPLVSVRDWPQALRSLGIQRVLVTLPDPRRREEEILAARAAGLTLINAIHPTTQIMPDAIIGLSIVMHARAYVGYRAEVRDGVILGVGSQVDHHSVIDTCATLDPGAVTAGNCYVGPRARLHTGAVLKNRIQIGADAIVGAGTVVIRDVEPNWVVVGSPARRIDSLPPQYPVDSGAARAPGSLKAMRRSATGTVATRVEPRSKGKWTSLVCFVGRDMEYGRRAIGIFLSKGIEVAAICGETAAFVRGDLASEWDVANVPVFTAKRPWRDVTFLRFLDDHPAALGVGCGLDYIVSPDLLKRLPFVNGHPAVLPYNRGCHHSFWGIMEKTNFGASLHWMSAEIDAGPVIAQRSFEDDGEMVAGAIQKKSNDLCLALFSEEIEAIMAGDRPGIAQPPGGSYHAKAEIVGASTLHSGDTVEVDRLYDLCRATNAKNNGFIISKDGRRFMIRISAIEKL